MPIGVLSRQADRRGDMQPDIVCGLLGNYNGNVINDCMLAEPHC